MRNIEELRSYFLGKDPQLKETMSDNSLRLCGIEGKHYVLRTELINRLGELKKYVDDNDKELRDAIDKVIDDLASEVTTRRITDGYLEQSINRETSQRTIADGRLEGLISTEQAARILADNNIIARFNNYYNKSEINQMISTIPRFGIEVVDELPTQDISTTTIYLVPSADPETANSYDEFIYVDNEWEQIGTTAIDMSDYYTKQEVDAKTFTTTLTQDITIYDGNPTIAGLSGTGWYFTGEHVVNSGNGEDINILAHKNTLFYYWENPDVQNDNFLWFLPATIEDGVWLIHLMLYFDLDNNDWVYSGYDITEQVNGNSNDLQVPTAGAVAQALRNNGGGFKTLDTQQIIKVYELDTDTYYLPDPGVGYSTSFNYNSAHSRSLFGNAWLFVDKNDSGYTSWFMIQGDAGFPTLTSGYCTTTTGTNGYIFDIEANRLEDSGHRVTSISSSSTDTQYPSAKAVYDSLPTVFSGTDGVNAGTSGLVPQPLAVDDGKYLCADGTWAVVNIPTITTADIQFLFS